MFLVAMLYLFGLVVATIACAYSPPSWFNGGQQPSSAHPSAVLAAGLLWPLLLVGATQFAMLVALHKVEVHKTVHASMRTA
ncbi:hypothetical protein BH09ACT8_BH09ACT8_61630 [soil metagenome]